MIQAALGASFSSSVRSIAGPGRPSRILTREINELSGSWARGDLAQFFKFLPGLNRDLWRSGELFAVTIPRPSS